MLYVFLLGGMASLFIIFFKPFDIENKADLWYFNLILLSMGLIFSLSIYGMEFWIPGLFKSRFKKWTLGKAILWYTWLLLFVSAVMFLAKSFFGGFSDFTVLEYVYVTGRIAGIGLIISFFTLGIFSYFNNRTIASLSSNEQYQITAPNAKPITLHLNEVLYIVSDDNYVDIHIKSKKGRSKIVFRSSLKNIESQIVHPLSPLYRCHRRYIINATYFKVKSRKSRNASLELVPFGDEIAVSSRYASNILEQIEALHQESK
ncbi:MAG: LytTR family DNA-binding domain-containing protein [Bacteroidota bacterium]